MMNIPNRLAIAALLVVSLAACQAPPVKEDGEMSDASDSSGMQEKPEAMTVAAAEKTEAAAEAPAEMAETRITTEAQYRELVVDRKFGNDYGWAINHADGTMSGEFVNKELTGVWAWEGGYFCRSGLYGGEEMPRNCQVVVVKGETITFIRDEGTGKKNTYTFNPE